MIDVSFANAPGAAQAHAYPVFTGGEIAAPDLAPTTHAALARALKAARATGKAGQMVDVIAPEGSALDRVLLIGVGDKKAFAGGGLETAAAHVVRALLVSGVKAAALRFDALEAAPDAVARAGLAAQLASYRFDAYRTKLAEEKRPTLKKLVITSPALRAARAAWRRFGAVAEGAALARDLVSEPANILTPPAFALRCKALAQHGLEVEVLGEAQMAKLGMNALLGVGQGSQHESQLVVMQWKGGGQRKKPLALVGKGVCFDTGGISIKPADGMWDMKGDMGGAAAVAGAMLALAKRQAKANVVGIIGLVENMPDGKAQRPGDIVVSMSKQTIEVLNTDAEGRLVLADALWYAQDRFKPHAMIDLATLTGAMLIALGQEHAGLFSNDDELAQQVLAASLAADEPVWRMPLGPAYDKLIDTPNADMKNIGGRNAGSITAAQFLKRFVNDARWAHLDIAPTAWRDKRDDPREPVWATGWGVRLLDELVATNFE